MVGEMMNNKEKNNISINDYFSNAMLVFLALGLDVVVSIGINKLIPLNIWYKKIIANSTTIVIWIIAIVLTYKYIRSNNIKNIVTLNLNKKIMAWFTVIFLLLITTNLIIKSGNLPQFISEFTKLKYKYKEYGVHIYIVQNIYYLLEAMLITLIIVFGQRWGELKFKNIRIPYGSIVLCLSWGLVHILIQDISTGAFAIISSLIVGIGFLLCKKNLVLTYILAVCVFII